MAQLVEQCTGIAEVWVQNPPQAFILAATEAAQKCNDQIHSFHAAFQIQILVLSSPYMLLLPNHNKIEVLS